MSPPASPPPPPSSPPLSRPYTPQLSSPSVTVADSIPPTPPATPAPALPKPNKAERRKLKAAENRARNNQHQRASSTTSTLSPPQRESEAATATTGASVSETSLPVEIPPIRPQTSTPAPPAQLPNPKPTKAQRRANYLLKHPEAATHLSSVPPPPTPAMPPPRLLIASIGNPAPYLSTLHSAGHLVLSALSSSLNGSSFVKSRSHGNGLLSTAYIQTTSGEGAEVTMWQSPALMNVSGPSLASAYKTFLRDSGAWEGGTGLVVLHDELESPLGKLRIRPGSNSPKGHNGLKSIRQAMGDVRYTRIGLGIGRPVSREPEEVARWCLRRWTEREREGLLGVVGEVEREVRRIIEKGV